MDNVWAVIDEALAKRPAAILSVPEDVEGHDNDIWSLFLSARKIRHSLGEIEGQACVELMEDCAL